MVPTHVWVDGRIVPADGPHLSVADRGFQLGDGVFETLRARAGRSVELAEHVARLRHSLEMLQIDPGRDLAPWLESAIAELLAAEGLAGPDGDAAVRITISRGTPHGRGVLPTEGTHPTVAVQAWPVEPPPAAYLADGLRVIVSSIRRDPEHPLSAAKSTSRAESVFARLEAQQAGADDAIYLTLDGYLSEATSANLFVVRDGELATPALTCAILPGTTRAWLLGWAARVGLRPAEGLLTTRDLVEADEAFVSSSVAGVLPVTRFEGAAVGSGVPGRWTRQARAAREACFEDPLAGRLSSRGGEGRA
jgi:branched-chain amino acid aminotransferase